jgi:hypothetical protein
LTILLNARRSCSFEKMRDNASGALSCSLESGAMRLAAA